MVSLLGRASQVFTFRRFATKAGTKTPLDELKFIPVNPKFLAAQASADGSRKKLFSTAQAEGVSAAGPKASGWMALAGAMDGIYRRKKQPGQWFPPVIE